MGYLRLLLLPFSAIYGAAVWLRNCFYNWGWLKQTAFDIPVIVVGNLAVGGTGKSPMIEYLIRLLAPEYSVATLSRGYGRSTRGFREVQLTDTAAESGDEPLQFKRKFPEITVAVCEDRVAGVRRLQALGYRVILLDDAFQHRALKPGLAILLFDYSHMRTPKWLLPAGNYRDWFSARRRADVLIVTKTPDTATAEDKATIRKQLTVTPEDIPLWFAGIDYDKLLRASPVGDGTVLLDADTAVLLVTGIANPDPLHRYLAARVGEVVHLRYTDHHPYSSSDIQRVKNRYAAIPNSRKIIVTTEKDSQRLFAPPHAAVFDGLPVYVLPIRFTLERQEAHAFQQRVLQYCADTLRQP